MGRGGGGDRKDTDAGSEESIINEGKGRGIMKAGRTERKRRKRKR